MSSILLLAIAISAFVGSKAPLVEPKGWLPPVAIGRFLGFGRFNGAGFVWIVVAILLLIGSEGPPAIRGWATLLSAILVVPAAFYTVQAARAAGRLKLRELRFFNPITEVGTSFERVIEDGATRDIAEPIVLFMTDADWKSLGNDNAAVRNQFENHYKIAPDLYRSAGDNEFLQVFDSLQLWPFVVHPGNEQAMEAFRNALRLATASKLSLAAASVDAGLEPEAATAKKPKRPRTPPPPMPGETSAASPTPPKEPERTPPPASAEPPPASVAPPVEKPAPAPPSPEPPRLDEDEDPFAPPSSDWTLDDPEPPAPPKDAPTDTPPVPVEPPPAEDVASPPAAPDPEPTQPRPARARVSTRRPSVRGMGAQDIPPPAIVSVEPPDED